MHWRVDTPPPQLTPQGPHIPNPPSIGQGRCFHAPSPLHRLLPSPLHTAPPCCGCGLSQRRTRTPSPQVTEQRLHLPQPPSCLCTHGWVLHVSEVARESVAPASPQSRPPCAPRRRALPSPCRRAGRRPRMRARRSRCTAGRRGSASVRRKRGAAPRCRTLCACRVPSAPIHRPRRAWRSSAARHSPPAPCSARSTCASQPGVRCVCKAGSARTNRAVRWRTSPRSPPPRRRAGGCRPAAPQML